jgi:16S rRNA (guanine(966)-N(2))-methyltransferase RsmD
MRVIAGLYRSRVLKSLKGRALRPTSDRLRETLFDVLGDAVAGSHFLDLFAGTGAIGIEALSRGAREVVFVENHAATVRLIRANLASLGVKSGTRVIEMDALRALERPLSTDSSADADFDYVFLDPPYAATAEYSRVLDFFGAGRLLTPQAIVIAEHSRRQVLAAAFGVLEKMRVLEQGDAALSFFQAAK